MRSAYAASSGTTPLPSIRSLSTRAMSSREASPSATLRKAGSSSGALSSVAFQFSRSLGPGGKGVGQSKSLLGSSCRRGCTDIGALRAIEVSSTEWSALVAVDLPRRTFGSVRPFRRPKLSVSTRVYGIEGVGGETHASRSRSSTERVGGKIGPARRHLRINGYFR